MPQTCQEKAHTCLERQLDCGVPKVGSRGPQGPSHSQSVVKEGERATQQDFHELCHGHHEHQLMISLLYHL